MLVEVPLRVENPICEWDLPFFLLPYFPISPFARDATSEESGDFVSSLHSFHPSGTRPARHQGDSADSLHWCFEDARVSWWTLAASEKQKIKPWNLPRYVCGERLGKQRGKVTKWSPFVAMMHLNINGVGHPSHRWDNPRIGKLINQISNTLRFSLDNPPSELGQSSKRCLVVNSVQLVPGMLGFHRALRRKVTAWCFPCHGGAWLFPKRCVHYPTWFEICEYVWATHLWAEIRVVYSCCLFVGGFHQAWDRP